MASPTTSEILELLKQDPVYDLLVASTRRALDRAQQSTLAAKPDAEYRQSIRNIEPNLDKMLTTVIEKSNGNLSAIETNLRNLANINDANTKRVYLQRLGVDSETATQIVEAQYGRVTLGVRVNPVAVDILAPLKGLDLSQERQILAERYNPVETTTATTGSQSPPEQPRTSAPRRSAPAQKASGKRTLREGMTGEDVKELQTFLKSQGHFGDTEYQEGVFDQATKDAVEAFQAQHELGVDGVVGYGPTSETGPKIEIIKTELAELARTATGATPAQTTPPPSSTTPANGVIELPTQDEVAQSNGGADDKETQIMAIFGNLFGGSGPATGFGALMMSFVNLIKGIFNFGEANNRVEIAEELGESISIRVAQAYNSEFENQLGTDAWQGIKDGTKSYVPSAEDDRAMREWSEDLSEKLYNYAESEISKAKESGTQSLSESDRQRINGEIDKMIEDAMKDFPELDQDRLKDVIPTLNGTGGHSVRQNGSPSSTPTNNDDLLQQGNQRR